MKTYCVNIPVAAHASIEVEAEDEDSAIEKAMEEMTIGNIEEWEPLKIVSEGNFLHFPTPWEAEATEV